MKLLSLVPVVAVGGLLLFAAQDFPEWGDPASPASTSPVSSHFIQSTGVDTEVPNMVTAVLADYRGFDTMFETVVVFIAGMAVLAILKGSGRRRSVKREHEVEAECKRYMYLCCPFVRPCKGILRVGRHTVLRHTCSPLREDPVRISQYVF